MVSQSELRDVPPWLPEHFTGGHPAFDFINTVSHRADPALAVDRFDRLGKIAAWGAFADLFDEAALLGLIDDEADIVEALGDLRANAGAVFDAIADQRTDDARDLGFVLRTAGEALLTGQDSKLETPQGIAGWFALQVLDAYYRLPHQRIRACPGCRWLFHDSSRGGRRKWCSMADCGNRAKVRRHYRKHKADTA